LDILAYWKAQEARLPLLSKVAKKYYSIPVTSITSEKTSEDDDVASFRTFQSTTNAEQLVYLYDNCRKVANCSKTWKIRLERDERV
jgi:hAT family C-terminal dimerisation region